jgi:hypothetical protein
MNTAPPTMVNSALDEKGLALLEIFIVNAPPRLLKPTVCSARQSRGGTPSLNAARMQNDRSFAEAQFDELAWAVDRVDAGLGRIRDARCRAAPAGNVGIKQRVDADAETP